MSADAIAVFNPKDLEQLKPFLDLDDESDESDGLYAELLEDGSVLVHTFQPFAVFEENPNEARVWLEQFGDVLADVHDDPRGILFFPDTYEPTATTYDAVVGEMADKGVWVFTGIVDAPALPATSFEIGRLFHDVQRELVEALGVSAAPGADADEIYDEEFAPDPDSKKQR